MLALPSKHTPNLMLSLPSPAAFLQLPAPTLPLACRLACPAPTLLFLLPMIVAFPAPRALKKPPPGMTPPSPLDTQEPRDPGSQQLEPPTLLKPTHNKDHSPHLQETSSQEIGLNVLFLCPVSMPSLLMPHGGLSW